MAVSDLEHLKALRESDQKAIELLARANATRISTGLLVISIMVSIFAVAVAIAALLLGGKV